MRIVRGLLLPIGRRRRLNFRCQRLIDAGLSPRSTRRLIGACGPTIVVGVLQECFMRFKHGHSYEITTAGSAAEAFAILPRETFDLILLDNVLPGIGAHMPFRQGLDLLRRVRSLCVVTPILMMTGASDAQREAEARIEGATGYLHTPFDLGELDRLVRLAFGFGPATDT